ncbi:MAG: regulatory protein RecX [Solirubrobacterales bacterium]|nr:regulatory protein RecX [Solirubrobacterales bacterium]
MLAGDSEASLDGGPVGAGLEGSAASEGGLDGVPAGAGVEKALAIAYRHLNRRECSEAEMRVRLGRAAVDPPEAEQAIAILLEQGYLDDERFARLFAQDKRELEQWGSDRIRQALRARGVPSDLVVNALDELPGESELERATAVLRRRFPSPVGDRRERERALGVLLRKGYGSELALDAIAAHTRDAVARGYPDSGDPAQS